jgi:hypothetical protein
MPTPGKKAAQLCVESSLILRFTLPNSEDKPSVRLQNSNRFVVPSSISDDLFRPKRYSAFRQATFRTSVAMPKAPVHKDHRPMFREYDVGIAGQRFPVQPKSKAHPVQRPPNGQFRPRVSAANASHYEAALFRRPRIHPTCFGLRPTARPSSKSSCTQNS